MTLRALLVTAVTILPWTGSRAEPSGWEIQGLVGATAPTYSQTFGWSPPPIPDLPGIDLQQDGSFELKATGGLAFAGGLTFFASDGVGIEARIDTADIDLETRNARFSVRVPLPDPLPDFATDVDLQPAAVDLKRLTPLSANLRLRIPGPVALNLSGGVSYLPELKVDVVQPLAVGVTGLDPILETIDVGEIPIRAAIETGTSGSRVGGNAGLGLQIRLGRAVSLAVDLRGFLFPKQRLVWSADPDEPLNPAEQVVVEEVLRQLRPIEFNPTFFNATAGLSIAF